MASESFLPSPLRLILYLGFTIALVWVLHTSFAQYFMVEGGNPAYIIIGTLLTMMNLLLRPLLNILILPFRFFFALGLLAIIAANVGLLWLTERIVAEIDPGIATLDISGGIGGWLLIAMIVGIAHWLMQHVIR